MSAIIRLTDNETNLTVMVVIATGHHGADGIIDHSNNVNVEVLMREQKRKNVVWYLKLKMYKRSNTAMSHLKLHVTAILMG